MISKQFQSWLESEKILVECGSYRRDKGYGDVKYLVFKNTRLHNRALLYVHGTGNDACYMAEGLFSDLLMRGFIIFTFDLDGHGAGSSGTFNLDELPSAVPQAFQVFKNLLPKHMAISLLGVSLGGVLAFEALAKAAVTANELVLIATPFSLQTKVGTFLAEALSPLDINLYRYGKKWGFTSLLPALGPFRRHLYPLRMENAASSWAYVAAVREYIEGLQRQKPVLPSQLKVLALYGSCDRLASWQDAQATLSKNDFVKVQVIPGVNHFLSCIEPRIIKASGEFLTASGDR